MTLRGGIRLPYYLDKTVGVVFSEMLVVKDDFVDGTSLFMEVVHIQLALE